MTLFVKLNLSQEKKKFEIAKDGATVKLSLHKIIPV